MISDHERELNDSKIELSQELNQVLKLWKLPVTLERVDNVIKHIRIALVIAEEIKIMMEKEKE
jgi:hypothetical protein